MVNSKGETMFQLHQQTAKDFGEFEGFYWLLKYNALGQVTDWTLLPFENCRLGKPDDRGWISKIYYNPFFGTSEYGTSTRKYTVEYDVFAPTAVKSQMQQQGTKYKGQVLYFGTTTATSRFYPLPEAFASIKWMGIEKGVSDYHEDNINNGFLQAFMLVMKGDPNAPSTNPEYQNYNGDQPATLAQEFDEVVSNNFMGAKRVGNMFVQWVSQGNEAPEVIPMPSNNNGDLFVTIDNQSTKKITIAWKVPGVLANIHEGVSLGGDANQIRVAVQLMQQRVVREQRMLTDNYQKVLSIMDTPYAQPVTITPYNPYPELVVPDQKIWDAMSPEERRDWIEENTEIVLGPDQPVPTQARMTNALPVSFPKEVVNNVKRALDYVDKMGIKCIGRGSRQVSDAIMANESMGLKQMNRIYNYLKKNSRFESSLMNEGCNVIEYMAWGGKPMEKFLEVKLEEFKKWLN